LIYGIVSEIVLPNSKLFYPPDVSLAPNIYRTFSTYNNSQIFTESVYLLRKLRKDAKWGKEISSVVKEGISYIDGTIEYFNSHWDDVEYVKAEGNTWTNIVKTLASLSILGGSIPVIRSGCRIRTKKI